MDKLKNIDGSPYESDAKIDAKVTIHTVGDNDMDMSVKKLYEDFIDNSYMEVHLLHDIAITRIKKIDVGCFSRYQFHSLVHGEFFSLIVPASTSLTKLSKQLRREYLLKSLPF